MEPSSKAGAPRCGAEAWDVYVDLVRQATLAASSHNTQPWKFRLSPGSIEIVPDLERRCPEVDPDDHHLYASLGCAAENLLVAAQAAGLNGRFRFDSAQSRILIELAEGLPVRSPLFDAIAVRQCSRVAFDGAALPAEQLRLLEEAGRGDGVAAMVITDDARKEQVAAYVAAGNRAQFGNPRWAAEMRKWIRFNGKQARRSGDGLYGAALGIPDLPAWLGRLLMRVAVSAERQSRKDAAHIRSSAAIVVLHSDADDKAHWVEAGRSYQRLALQAAALDLRTALINQPVEVAPIRREFAAFLGIGARRPDLVVRVGRGRQMPRSFRRAVEDVLI